MRAALILTSGILTSAGILVLRSGGPQPLREAGAGEWATVAPLSSDPALPAKASAPQSAPNAHPSPRPLRPGDAVPDVTLTDQDGNRFTLSDLRPNTVVLTFIYTHCNIPSMCPLVTSKLVRLQRELRERGLDNVEIVAVSFDTERDRSSRLKEFAARYEADLSSFRLATGEPGAVKALSGALNTYYRRVSADIFEHNIVVSLIRPDGVLGRDFFGTRWEVEEVVAALQAPLE